MVLLSEIMDLDLLDEMIEGGFVTARQHNSLPLIILNYTPKAQYEWVWNDVTLKARGLIFNKLTHEVVARPFEKFFNWDQGIGRETWQNPMPPSGPAIRMEKMDGSLGVLYNVARLKTDENDIDFDNMYRIATRGSFHSEQAEWATEFMIGARKTHPELWRERQPRDEHGNPHPDFDSYNGIPPWIKGPATDFYAKHNKTYLFEIIFPENRIVVDYGDYKGLVLIDVIDNETGKSDLQEFDDCKWPDKVKRVILFKGFDSGQTADIPPGDEGFVYLWPEKNYRTKMKSAEYMELHRLVSRLSEKTIWEMLVAGKTADQIKAGLPDEFYGFVDKTVHSIQEDAMTIVRAAQGYMRKYENEGWTNHRKDFALAVKDNPYKKYLFMMLDGKPIYPLALAASKPKTNKALVSSEDI